MKQAPAFLLIGGGRLARHLAEYFRLLGIEISRWSRNETVDLASLLRTASHVLLAISDDAIGEFHERWRGAAGAGTVWVHFSGARVFRDIAGAHPLMTFGQRLYDLPTYTRIPFIVERGGPPLDSLLKGLPNPSFEIAPDKKPLYHAWAVLATSAVSGTWREYRRLASQEFSLPEAALRPFLEQTARNALDLDAPLTGPIARGDAATIQANLRALEGSAYEPVYRALVTALGRKQS